MWPTAGLSASTERLKGMLLQGWALALMVTFLGTLFLGLYAAFGAVRILRYWDQSVDTALQIRLEGETWLLSALMQYGLFFQLFSLILLVLAADSFSGQLAGAMCATGAFTANVYGIPALLIKIVMAFCSGYWLLLHRLDLQVETYPLVRLKYGCLLLLVPLLLVDGTLQSLYLFSLEPDVITSCCGVLFRPAEHDGHNLLNPFSVPLLLSIFYPLAGLLVGMGIWLHRRILQKTDRKSRLLMVAYAWCWVLFFIVSLWAITVFFSSYIYAMPSHRCPFDILQAEYNYVGYPLYLSLFAATFLGTGCGVAELVRCRDGLEPVVDRFQVVALPAALILLIIFLLLSGYAPLRYIIAGGEG